MDVITLTAVTFGVLLTGWEVSGMPIWQESVDGTVSQKTTEGRTEIVALDQARNKFQSNDGKWGAWSTDEQICLPAAWKGLAKSLVAVIFVAVFSMLKFVVVCSPGDFTLASIEIEHVLVGKELGGFKRWTASPQLRGRYALAAVLTMPVFVATATARTLPPLLSQ
jgi:hypothetical protein